MRDVLHHFILDTRVNPQLIVDELGITPYLIETQPPGSVSR